MKIEYVAPKPGSLNPGSRDGYWYACTDNKGYDAAGPTFELAMARLCSTLERALKEQDD